MPKISEVYSANYVQASEFPKGTRVRAVIFNAEAETMGQDQQVKIALTLRHPDGRQWPRKVVLNKTNSLILAAALGDDTITWPGHTIELWSEPVTFQGRLTQGIRMMPVSAQSNVAPLAVPRAAAAGGAAAAQPIPGTSVAEALDDDIPF